MRNLVEMFNELAFNDFAMDKNHIIKKQDENTTLFLSVPGFSREDIKITIDNKELLIESEKENKVGSKLSKKYLISDDFDDIKASVENGILEIIFLKKKKDKKIINIL